ncbi:MAG: sialate O-acetylesterase, partial [Phycisphaerae bacterium]|nr:sialate O-acetylesterase [Phycisphaerae bacterium]
MAVLVMTGFAYNAAAAAKPLKVYIMAGQSNMQGAAHKSTFAAIGDDPTTAALLSDILDKNGDPVVCDNVRVTYLTGGRDGDTVRHGKMKVGYGFDGDRIGPEYGFGIYIDKALDEPVLIIKTAWGGKSLAVDFRSPSAGPYQPSAIEKERGSAPAREKVGHYYREMIRFVQATLKDPESIRKVVPDYDASQGYELAGFVWFQGWNDMCNRYHIEQYTENMIHFISDVRKTFNAPRLPFIVGILGVYGTDPDSRLFDKGLPVTAFRKAQFAAVAQYDQKVAPPYRGHVVAVDSGPYYDLALSDIYWKRRMTGDMKRRVKQGEMTQAQLKAECARYGFGDGELTAKEKSTWDRCASNAEYHYLGSGKTFVRFGKALAEAMVKMRESDRPSGLTNKDAMKPVTYAEGRLSNGIVSVAFDPQGTFSIQDAQSDEVLLSGARFGLPRGRSGKVVKMYCEDIKDVLGVGKRVMLEVHDFNELGYRGWGNRPYAYLLYSYALYENNPALVCGFGVKMPNYFSFRLREGTPLGGGEFFGGTAMNQPMTLNGSAGAEKTLVTAGLTRRSANSLMLTGLVDGKRRTAVWGGLANDDFGKYAILQEGSPTFYAEDPIGRLVDEDQIYIAKDTFYLDVYTAEPFDALERYGLAMRVANNASPNVYDFPVLCGWSVGNISRLPNVNNSAKLIGELEHANQCGLTKYTKVSLRLEPDKYHLDTEQGWWDDAHMQTFKHLVEPYETIARWGKKMNSMNGVPYIYMQLGMPSDDFVRQYPQYMLFNDGSEVDKRTPNTNWRNKHPHHQPYVTYDYTDKEYSKHFVKVWSKLRKDGIRGVKVDYPATAWRPEGGFDDRYATTNSAYRRAFTLLREAMGKDGLIDERNLGESSRPCLDVTAGLVDTQRTWGDSNEFVPEMVSKSGLRWYKNRTVFNYYSDTKGVHNQSKGLLQSLITMNFLTSGRLDLATSFSLFTPEVTQIVSRSYPHYPDAKTARPLDAFTGVTDPQVYDLALTGDWHQVALYNTTEEKAVISTAISGERVNNAIGLDPTADYHAYEFWSDTYLGKLPGTARIERELSPNCCAMISLRKAQPYPQVISTNRHVLQGWVELEDVRWDAEKRTLRGTAYVIGGEPFKVIVADNGAKV